MKTKLPVGKYFTCQMLGSTIKKISTLIGRGSTISLPVVGAPQVFALEVDIYVDRICNEYTGNIDDNRLYWVTYSNSPELYGSEFYATVSIGYPDADSTAEYYGLTY